MILRVPSLTFSAAFCQDMIIRRKFDPYAARALKANTDGLGEEVLASGEPSFTRVDNYFPASPDGTGSGQEQPGTNQALLIAIDLRGSQY